MPWIATIPVSAIDEEGLGRAQVGPLRVAIFRVDDEFYATADLCTHGQASLSQGYLEGHLIECPLHQGMFDVRTGAAVGAPCTVAVRAFPTKVEDGLIHIEIAQGEA